MLVRGFFCHIKNEIANFFSISKYPVLFTKIIFFLIWMSIAYLRSSLKLIFYQTCVKFQTYLQKKFFIFRNGKNLPFCFSYGRKKSLSILLLSKFIRNSTNFPVCLWFEGHRFCGSTYIFQEVMPCTRLKS